MKKEELVRKFNEGKIFNELKDVYFDGMRDLRSRYKDVDADLYEVYRKIINYRINKYGSSCFVKPDCDDYKTSKELLKMAHNVNKHKRRMLRSSKLDGKKEEKTRDRR